ncbi:MAG TPA: long-chain fatty acid--CoA ligase [Spirochaetota bacterium]|nr:long-chain fatty acid--CoA ligase [Spirochaetota bacterium]HPF06375.1 long-chain fatty acid--CoA ligase [Spirochaetota bacterium]HRX49422.1 long-chain fatty acid--CoA ligase [Spirochaetota bacterium]
MQFNSLKKGESDVGYKFRNRLNRVNLTEKFKAEKAELEKEFQEVLDRQKHHSLCIINLSKKFGDRAVLHDKAYGSWQETSWNQLAEQMHAVAAALLESGITEGDRVGIFSNNRAEWHIADLGSMLIRAIDVPIYPTNSTKEAEYIVNHSGLKVLFLAGQTQYDRGYPLLDKCPGLEKIVVFHRDTKIHNDPRVIMWGDFLAMGRKAGHKDKIEDIKTRCHYDDPCTIVYTSGTTGEPKGVVLTHKNFMHNGWSIGKYTQGPFSPDDSTFSWLPLSHALERSWDYGFLTSGSHIWYCDDHTKVMEYIQEANTTHMFNAARLFEKVYSTLFTKIKEAPEKKQKIFFWSIKVAKEAGEMVLAGKVPPLSLRFKRSLADKLVLHKVRDLFGKNMHHVGSGGSSLNPEIEKFFFYCGMLVTQGYGLTETAPGIIFNGHQVFRLGTVGGVVPLSEMRIDPASGELQFRGPNVFKEYYKNPQATKEAFTEDGWFRSGDVGIMDDDGFVAITDRLKDLIITAGGKNVAPQKIEVLMCEDHYIENVAVAGEGKKYITAIIAPDFINLAEWAAKNGIEYSSNEELIAKPEVTALYKDIIDRRQKDLGQVEQIKKFTLIPQIFSQEAGEVTPTLKIKRKVVLNNYRNLVEAMYAE